MEVHTLRTTEDSHWGEFQASLSELKNEVRAFLNSKPAKVESAAPHKDVRNEPWRMSLAEFIDYKDDVEADWDDNGNAKVGQRLAKALKRVSGHAEGQLYIDWCKSVGRDKVRAFWIGRGKTEIPDGL
jgi:hypothetical protein